MDMFTSDFVKRFLKEMEEYEMATEPRWLPHPLHPHFIRRGNTWEGFEKLVNLIKPSAAVQRLDGIYLRGDPSRVPDISFTPGGRGWLLGEVGLQYLVYRLGGELDLPRKLYRAKRWPELQSLLQLMHVAEVKSGRLSAGREVVITSIEDELTGILLNYVAMTNHALALQIDRAAMSKFVKHWFWRPLESAIYFDFAMIFEKFHYGAVIRNGETGHRAMSFASVLWTEDVLVIGTDAVRSIGQAWETSIADSAYRRHTSAHRISLFIRAIKSTFKESEHLISLKRSQHFPGSVAVDALWAEWPSIKGRDSVKTKMEAAIKDLAKVSATGSSLDVIDSIIQASDILATQAADRVSEQAVSIILKRISEV
jgi:hypothetical protein